MTDITELASCLPKKAKKRKKRKGKKVPRLILQLILLRLVMMCNLTLNFLILLNVQDVGRKEKKSVVEESQPEEETVTELPTVDKDDQLKKIAETTKKKENEVKRNKTKKESFLSVSDKTKDGEIPKVPSYSYKKNRGVVYISHIPHGFYEEQMREFFGQFGIVTNLRLGRSAKTGGSKGYAFVEFKYKEVASVIIFST